MDRAEHAPAPGTISIVPEMPAPGNGRRPTTCRVHQLGGTPPVIFGIWRKFQIGETIDAAPTRCRLFGVASGTAQFRPPPVARRDAGRGIGDDRHARHIHSSAPSHRPFAAPGPARAHGSLAIEPLIATCQRPSPSGGRRARRGAARVSPTRSGSSPWSRSIIRGGSTPAKRELSLHPG